MASKPPLRAIEDEDSRIDVLRYLRVVWRRRIFVLLPVIFITSITALGVRFMSPLFVSRAKLHVELRTRVNSELERHIVDEDRRVRRKDQLGEVRTQIMNREFLEGVVRELGLHNDPTTLARAKMLHDTRTPDVPVEEIAMRNLVRGLRDKIGIKNAEDNQFTLAVADNDAESAYILAKVITRSFVNEVKRERMDKLDELLKFSSQQQQINQQKVEAVEKELREFQSQLIREQNAASPVNVANVGAAKAQIRRMELDEDQAERRVETLRSVLRQAFDPLPDLRALRGDKEVVSLERRLRGGLEDEAVSDLARAMSPTPTAELPEGEGATRSALRRRLSELVESRYTSTEPFYRDKVAEYAYESVALDAQRVTHVSLTSMIDRYTRKAESQPEKELQLAALQERATAARTNLETFERSLQSAELSETILATQLAGGVSLVDPPEKPVVPVKPNRGRLTLLAFLLSVLGGLGSVFALDYLDKSFKDVDEVQRYLGLHVVGTVPRVTTGMPFGGLPVNRKKNYMLASSFGLLLLVLSGMALYEKLLRKQHVTVPHARAEEILRGGEAPSAPTSKPAP